jgi:hypothetical protein
LSLLCRIGFHRWQETELVRAEDIIACMYEGDVCQRCGKVDDPESAREAYFMMLANLRSQSGFRFTVHPALGIRSDAARHEGGS